MGMSVVSIIVLTFVVALISAQVSYKEMSGTLYGQGVQLAKNLVESSVAPLLYDSVISAENMVDTLVDMPQISEVGIYHVVGKALIERVGDGHVSHGYLDVSEAKPVQIVETSAAWYISMLVVNKYNAGNLADSFLELEQGAVSSALGYVHLTVSKTSINVSRQNIFMKNFFASASVGLMLLLIMYFVLRHLTQPLEALSALMEQGRQGNYSEDVAVSGTREITKISHTYSEMIAAIKEREENLSLTLDSIGDAVISTDINGCIIRMNPVAEALTGWSLKQATGKSVKDVFPIIDATTRKEIKNPVEKVLATGETVYLSNHTTLISKDKTEYQIADSAAPIRNEAGDILGMVLVFNDITVQYKLRQAAVKSERDMQAVMDNSPAAIYVKDLQGKYLFINRSFEALFKIKREDIVEKTDYNIFSKETADILHSNDQIVLDSKQVLEIEEKVPHDDGVHNYLSVKFPLFDEDEMVYAVCSISTDITERLKQEEKLQRSQKMDALGKLTGGVAHDYNNMLGVVMGYADLLELQLKDQPKLVDYVKKIIHAGERGSQLTKKLLAFSKQKSGDARILNLNELLRDESDMLQKVLTARITLVMELADDLWPVYVDSGDLEDAIVNLSINAMHAIKENGQLTISTRNKNISRTAASLLQIPSGDYIRLSVTDTGCGMDDVTCDKIFEPFFTTKGEKGTGLGLAQVYGFMGRSNGAVQVYSELGHGTEVVLYFPAQKTVEDGVQSKDAVSVGDYKGNETILLVDDEPALLELSSVILSQKGYRTIEAGDAKQALQILETETVDLIISDVIMPGMDGFQLAKLVQKKYPEIKIQLASGFTDNRHSDDETEILQAEMINKPYQANVLLKRIRQLLDENI